MTIRLVSPVDGSAVNITPDRSEGTIAITTTPMAGTSVVRRLARYAMTRAPYSEAQQPTTALATSSSPVTLVKVTFIPAKEVSLASSPVPEERTATTARSPRRW